MLSRYVEGGQPRKRPVYRDGVLALDVLLFPYQ
jgi:hypothetical protein